MEMQMMSKYPKGGYEGNTPHSLKFANSDTVVKNFKRDQMELRYEGSIPHREMAIDCPPNYLWMRKEAPRLPRPSSSAHDAYNTPESSVNFKQFPHSVSLKDANAESTRLEKLKRYQDDLQKKRDLEEKIQREQDLLRSSLRGSKKLQGLQEPPPLENGVAGTLGCLNPIFDTDGITLERKKSSALDTFSVEDILMALKHLKQQMGPQKQAEVSQIEKFVLKDKFKQAIAIHDQIVEVELREIPIPDPLATPAHEILSDVSLAVSASGNKDASELVQIFSDPHIRNVLLTHDKLIEYQHDKKTSMKGKTMSDQRDYLSQRAYQYGSDTIKIVQLHKTLEPLGLTIRNDGESIVIGRMVEGGVAGHSGLLREGDEILEINDVDIRGKTINDVYDMMNGKSGLITFLVNPTIENHSKMSTGQTVTKFVRALFDYDPEEDNYLPCKDMAISFEKGDILKVLDPRDNEVDYWQAYREAEAEHGLAGLVPSQNFQERRGKLRNMLIDDAFNEDEKSNNICRCLKRGKTKKDQDETAEILTYDEVVLYTPQPNFKRPIILIGPQNVGRQELRQRIMDSDYERFQTAIPHTTRPRLPGEKEKQDFHFVTRAAFEADILDGKFVEFGKYENHLFGTSLQSIRLVVHRGKTCILTFHSQALKVLKSSDLMPYVVFIAPPNIEKLKQLRQKEGFKVNDDELKKIIEQGREMETTYGHYFDLIIVNQDFDRSYEELLAAIDDLETKPQWVLSNWVA